ncbi:MAG: Gfo/Idh/MocA family oxidoreductase [Rhodospirillales bacterium]|jgi:predicted dehydrogenase
MTYAAAIIGCGKIGCGPDSPSGFALSHAGGYKRARGVELMAGADPDPANRRQMAERWSVTHAYEDWNLLYEAHRPDIVSLCVPTELHLSAFRDACNNGARAIFMEKPLAPTLVEAQQMPALAQDRLVVVAFHRRWNATLAKLAQEMQERSHGNVLQATIRYTKGLLVNGSHFIDLALWLLGKPVAAASLFRHPGGDPNDPGYDFRLDFQPGFSATFLHIPKAPYLFFEVDLLTDKGRVLIYERGQRLRIDTTACDATYAGLSTLDQGPVLETDWRDWPTKAVAELVQCLDTRRKPSCGLEDGLRVSAICHAIINNSGLIPYVD